VRSEEEPEPPSLIAADDVYDENGVDRSLIRWMLKLTPSKRLEYAQSAIDLCASVAETNDGSR